MHSWFGSQYVESSSTSNDSTLRINMCETLKLNISYMGHNLKKKIYISEPPKLYISHSKLIYI